MQPRKRLLIILLGFSLFCLAGLFWGIRQLLLTGFLEGQVLPWLWGGVIAGLAFLLFGVSALIFLVVWQRPIIVLCLPARWALAFLFPLAQRLGQLLKIDRLRLAGSYIAINNQLVWAERKKYRPREILLLVPHCLQSSTCPHKITHQVDNCRRCSRCQIRELLELREQLGINLAVATGGTLARRIVKKLKPKFILAVACERDLLSGITDSYPLPVIGVINERPHGPCQDTCIDVAQVKSVIAQLVREAPKTQKEE